MQAPQNPVVAYPAPPPYVYPQPYPQQPQVITTGGDNKQWLKYLAGAIGVIIIILVVWYILTHTNKSQKYGSSSKWGSGNAFSKSNKSQKYGSGSKSGNK